MAHSCENIIKIVEFKYDLRALVILADGREGEVCQLMHIAAGNKYEVVIMERTGKNRVTASYVIVKEEELSGHNLFNSKCGSNS